MKLINLWLLIVLTIFIKIKAINIVSNNVQESINSTSDIPLSERQALYDLYQSTNGPSWRFYTADTIPALPFEPPINLSSLNFGIPWNFTDNSDPCRNQWQGVNCTTRNGETHVFMLHLSLHHLQGNLPASLSNLTHLEIISLPYNHLNGTFPSSICTLHRLRYLDVDTNSFTGPLPNCIGNLTELRFLFFYLNQFTSTIPPSIGNLVHLNHLGLNKNQLTGSIPTSLGSLTEMQYLDLDTNYLTGKIPEGISNMTQMIGLNMATNRLTGSIPESFGNLLLLYGLYLNSNRLTGSIPYTVDRLLQLQYIVLDNNMLTGSILSCIGNMAELQYLGLNNNMLTGSIPAELSQLQDLRIVLLQSNSFSGSLDNVFNATMQTGLQSVALNNNQFTGTLPGALFQLPSLTSLVAVSNCFYGALPAEVCHSTAMISLVLDGLSSATSCRDNALPGISSSYVISNAVKGKIPSCLFQLPNLTTLHLSGNGFTGAFAENLQLSDALIDLSLSHNKLTGDIPGSVQTRQWTNLDLSYNRLSGSLHSNFGTVPLTNNPNPTPPPPPQSLYTQAQDLLPEDRVFPESLATSPTLPTPPPSQRNYTENTALSLENNRLSGKLPSTILHIQDISVLGSNIFQCKFDGDNLPNEDSGKNNYQCGSTAFNIPYYIWLALFLTITVGTLILFKSEHVKAYFSAQPWTERVCKYLSYSEERVYNSNNNTINEETEESEFDCTALVEYTNKIKLISRVTLWAACYSLCILLPLYAILSAYYGTLQHQYAWTASAAYLSGWNAIAWMLPVLAIMLIVLLVRFLRRIAEHKAQNVLLSRETVVERLQIKFESSTLRNAAVYCTYILLNTAVVVGVNVVYVYVAIYGSNRLLPVAQVALSLFKLFWNTTGTSFLLRITVGTLTCSSSSAASSSQYATGGRSGTADSSSRVRVYSETHSVFLQVFVAQLNNIVIPCLVVAVISPNCFYNLFVAAPDVDSEYSYEYCDLFTPTGSCVLYSPKFTSTSYNPPFTYSYQCSSSLITYYAPAFVLLCLVSSFVTPVAQLLLYRLHRSATPDTTWFRLLDLVLPAIFKPLPEEADSRAEQQTGRSTLNILTDNHSNNRIYFPANRVLLQVFTYLGMLLTFGAMFPPLAFALAVTIFIVMYFARLKAGWFIYNAAAAERYRYIRIVMRECQGVGSSAVLTSAMWMLVTISCGFYTLFLFDTLGDAVGFHHAYWLLIVVPLLSPVMYAVYYGYSLLPAEVLLLLPWHRPGQDSDSSERGTDLEMSHSATFHTTTAPVVHSSSAGQTQQWSSTTSAMHTSTADVAAVED